MTWWFQTKVETDREGKPVRVYHRNGGPFGGAGLKDSHKVTRAWTHPIDEKDGCEVCEK